MKLIIDKQTDKRRVNHHILGGIGRVVKTKRRTSRDVRTVSAGKLTKNEYYQIIQLGDRGTLRQGYCAAVPAASRSWTLDLVIASSTLSRLQRHASSWIRMRRSEEQ